MFVIARELAGELKDTDNYQRELKEILPRNVHKTTYLSGWRTTARKRGAIGNLLAANGHQRQYKILLEKSQCLIRIKIK